MTEFSASRSGGAWILKKKAQRGNTIAGSDGDQPIAYRPRGGGLLECLPRHALTPGGGGLPGASRGQSLFTSQKKSFGDFGAEGVCMYSKVPKMAFLDMHMSF